MTLAAVTCRVGLVLGLLAFAPVSGAQPPARVYRLGYLCAGFCDPGFENTGGGRLFRQTLSELGYTEGHARPPSFMCGLGVCRSNTDTVR